MSSAVVATAPSLPIDGSQLLIETLPTEQTQE